MRFRPVPPLSRCRISNDEALHVSTGDFLVHLSLVVIVLVLGFTTLSGCAGYRGDKIVRTLI